MVVLHAQKQSPMRRAGRRLPNSFRPATMFERIEGRRNASERFSDRNTVSYILSLRGAQPWFQIVFGVKTLIFFSPHFTEMSRTGYGVRSSAE